MNSRARVDNASGGADSGRFYRVVRRRRCVLGIVFALCAAFALVLMSGAAAFAQGVFSDVPESHRFYNEIMDLYGQGVISGFPDGTFRPDNPVTRAQFAKMIVMATDKHTAAVDNPDSPTFSDVTTALGTPYPYDYIEEAAAAGYVRGEAGLFRPYENISRVQLAIILVRAGGAALAEPDVDYDPGFRDVPAYAAAEVRKAKFNGLLDGTSPTTFDPWSNATRGQVCKMLSRLLAKLPRPTHRGLYFLGFNVNHPPFDDPLVRRALALAVDRQAIVDLVSATWDPATPLPLPATGVVPPSIPGFGVITQHYLTTTAQVQEAADLLEAAGYPGGEGLPEIVIRVNQGARHLAIANAVTAQWEAIGVHAVVEAIGAEYYDVIAQDDTMVFRMGWQTDFGDAYNILDIFRSDSENNLTRWGSEVYDDLLDQSLAPMSPEDRLAIYAQLETILTVEEMPAIPIYWF